MLNYNSVELLPTGRAAAAFQIDTTTVFREDMDIAPIQIDERRSFMPWGADNQMPYKILGYIEDDETLATCQMASAEFCYGSGLEYDTSEADKKEHDAVTAFLDNNNLPAYFLGVCQDFKHFGFCVTELILSNDNSTITNVLRKEACYCRFSPAGDKGVVEFVHYANWRKTPDPQEVESIPLLDPLNPLASLKVLAESGRLTGHKVCIVTSIPTPDSTYYPIPYYAALFKGRWYNIKQLIAIAKEAKLRNSAPIKYQIEISQRFWDGIFKAEGITDRTKQKERIVKEKQLIIDFITGAENAGKVLFSTFYVDPLGKEQHDVRITNIEDGIKEGGDWASDHAESVNMVCFTMRIHSNLVGSVPGKAQTNNSGSDKRELYTISQALQKPYHDLLFQPHILIMRFNGWTKTKPDVPFIQLTTLDQHQDARQVSTQPNQPNINDK